MRVATTLLLAFTLVACASNQNSMNPARKMARPGASAHWTLHLAYDIDGAEADYGGKIGGPVTTYESDVSLTFDDQPFAFQWLDYDGPTMIRSFTLRETGMALVTRLSYYEDVEDGQTILMPEYIRAEFKPSKDEQAALRKAIQVADIGRSPRRFAREDVYDGLQWRMYLRIGKQTKSVSFSNAVPERFRDLMVTIFRDVCAKHAGEIDKAKKMKGFAEFTDDDIFRG